MSTLATGSYNPASRRAVEGWRSVIVHVQADAAAEPRLKVAADLAARCDALLIGLGAECIDPRVYVDAYGGGCDPAFIEALDERVRNDFRLAHECYLRHATPGRAEWRAVEIYPSDALVSAARAADVIVTGGTAIPPPESHFFASTAEVVIKSGRPVLVAPSDARRLEGRVAVIAWKDTREARRAVTAALPLLKAADEVVVIEVSADASDEAQFRVDDVADALKRHGAHARGQVLKGHDLGAAEILCAEAAALGSDLIVAGCYGHSRIGEWLFGGVTRSLLLRGDFYLLMSH
jgi:nucleotide-binding universal stress UspA family protein